MAKRSRSKRAPKPRLTRPAKAKHPIWAIAIAAVLFVALLAGIAYELTRESAPTTVGDTVLVTVNGEAITSAELAFHYNLLPESYRSRLSPQDVLDELVSEELILQDATAQGIGATQEEVLARIQEILAASELTITELEENLADFNVTTEEFEALIARQIALEKWRAANIVAVEPTEEELLALYESNKDSYAVPERVTARHVLIRADRENAATLAKEIYDDVRAGGDLCAWVTKESDDQGSKATCGEYTFPRGYMVPEFEDAAFGMEDGEVRLIQSQFGYHVMTRLSLAPEGTLPYESVRDKILADARSAASAAAFDAKLSELRADAEIVYPLDEPAQEPVAPAQEPVAPEGDGVIAPAPEPEPVAPAPVEEAAPVEPEPTAPAPEPAEQPTGASDVLSCVAAKTVLYGTSWSTDSRDARQLFADAGVELRYVACDAQGASCVGVSAYPTWDIAGEKYLGRMTLEQLRRAASC